MSKEKHLLTTENEIEADIIISLLNSFGIDAIKKVNHSGMNLVAYTGTQFYQMDIFVREEKYQEALEVLENKKNLSDEDNENNDKDQDIKEELFIDYDKDEIIRRERMKRVVVALIMIVIILAIVYSTINSFKM